MPHTELLNAGDGTELTIPQFGTWYQMVLYQMVLMLAPQWVSNPSLGGPLRL